MERNVFGTCISVFLNVIELFVSQIFEDEYCSILYNIDTIFKILGWSKKKKIFGTCFDAFRHFEYFCTVFDFYFSFKRDMINNNYF